MGDAPGAEDSTSDGIQRPAIFPVDDATLPYWRTDLHPLDEYRSTEALPSECDVAIIGAGMSGVATAYHIVQASKDQIKPSIVLLEARQICSGATGRNGGHIKIQTPTVLKLIKKHGLEATQEVVDLVSNQIYAIKQVVESERLDCEFELRRSYDVFIKASDEAVQVQKDFHGSLQAGQEWTKNVDLIDSRHVEQVTSIKGAVAVLSVPACSLWPYKFVSQLLARLVEREAVNVQSNTPVSRIAEDGASGCHVLHTPRGSIKAKKLILATNAYTAGITHEYIDKIIPTRATATHIKSPSPVSPHLSHTYNIHYPPIRVGEERVDYLNPRPDGSIVVGGGKWRYAQDRARWYNVWDDSILLGETRPHFEGLMQRHFKGWENSGAGLDMIWTGIIGTTSDELPHIGEVPNSQGKYIIAGFNGGGMPLIFLCAKGLAKMVVEGVSYEETGLPRLFKTAATRLE